jgi:hypothetical protein
MQTIFGTPKSRLFHVHLYALTQTTRCVCVSVWQNLVMARKLIRKYFIVQQGACSTISIWLTLSPIICRLCESANITMARSVAVKWKINGHDKRHKNYIINSKNFIDKKIYDGKKGIS